MLAPSETLAGSTDDSDSDSLGRRTCRNTGHCTLNSNGRIEFVLFLTDSTVHHRPTNAKALERSLDPSRLEESRSRTA